MSLTSSIPRSYKAAVISEAKAGFVMKDIQVPELKNNEVLIRVEACGLCHSDSFVVDGGYPAVTYPRVPV
jgi:propanol-preferring alcohol dehydrogenase